MIKSCAWITFFVFASLAFMAVMFEILEFIKWIIYIS